MREAILTILCDNLAMSGYEAEHGFALHLQTDQLSLLMDTGSGATLRGNAQKAGVALNKLTHLVFSHGHYDHTGGIHTLSLGPDTAIIAHQALLQTRYSHHSDKPVRSIGITDQNREHLLSVETQIQWHKEAVILSACCGTSGAIPRNHPLEDTGGPFYLDLQKQQTDLIEDDQSLWLKTPDGLVIIFGCCHSGLINTIEQIKMITGETRVHGIIGGTHLLHANEARLSATVKYLQELKPDFLYPSHCTGERAAQLFREELAGIDVQVTRAGMQLPLTVGS